MFDRQLKLLVNQQQRISFVQGEDRQLLLQLFDVQTQSPLDLTGYSLTLAFPKPNNGSIKLRTAPLAFSFDGAAVLDDDTYFAIPGHGFVDGQTVQLNPHVDGDVLPLPFLSKSTYITVVRSADQVALRTVDGDKLPLEGASFAKASLTTTDFTLAKDDVLLGRASAWLSPFVTASVLPGQGQSYQLTLADDYGLRRIIIGEAQLDVMAQACP